jgi:hypothetical protein
VRILKDFKSSNLELRILKDLQTQFSDLRILKGLMTLENGPYGALKERCDGLNAVTYATYFTRSIYESRPFSNLSRRKPQACLGSRKFWKTEGNVYDGLKRHRFAGFGGWPKLPLT